MTKPIPLNHRHGWLGWWPADSLSAIFDPENARIKAFMKEKSVALPSNSKVLDAGAGRKPYKSFFKQHQYTSTDIPDGFYPEKHDFECYLDDIPQPDNHYDAVILSQVLEHVPNPTKALEEIYRILKPNGVLLLSVPLNTPLHGEPYHFFNFTHYGIQQLSMEIGYELIEVEKIGGAFWLLAKRFPEAFSKLLKQFDPFRAKKREQSVLFCLLMNLLLLPIYVAVYLPAQYLFKPLMYWFDCVDIQKTFTLGYTAVMLKPKHP